MLKIYGRANSINVRKLLWVADEIGLEYEREDWGRGFQSLDDPAFLARNPFALVPAIDDEGFMLSESNVIIRYLAAKHDRTDLLPVSLKERAVVERWMDWQGATLSNAVRPVFYSYVVKAELLGGEAELQAALGEWTACMQLVEAQLQRTGAFLLGDQLTLADICIGLMVHRWYAIEIPMEYPELPAIRSYYERLSQRPAFMAHGRNGFP